MKFTTAFTLCFTVAAHAAVAPGSASAAYDGAKEGGLCGSIAAGIGLGTNYMVTCTSTDGKVFFPSELSQGSMWDCVGLKITKTPPYQVVSKPKGCKVRTKSDILHSYEKKPSIEVHGDTCNVKLVCKGPGPTETK